MTRRARRAGVEVAALLLALAWPAARAGADPGLPPVSARPPLGPRPAVLWYPGFAREAALRAAWVNALEHEHRHEYLKAARIFEHLIGEAPEEPHTYWRIARDYAWLAELAPASNPELRARYGTLAMAWADRGLAIDPRCGECCFYKYAGMGRVAMAHGIFSSMRWLKQISQTLDRCMQTPPTFVHAAVEPGARKLLLRGGELLPDAPGLADARADDRDARRPAAFARARAPRRRPRRSAHRLQRRSRGIVALRRQRRRAGGIA